MSINRFEEIARSMHFADNSKIPADDKIYTISPIFEHFNNMLKNLAEPLPSNLATDEAMESYYGHHGFKQFIRGKPVRFGFKFWYLCSPEGFLISSKLYEGKDFGREGGLIEGEFVR